MGRLRFHPTGQVVRELAEHFGQLVRGRQLRDHLTVVGGGPENLRLERNDRGGLVLERLSEISGLDLGPFGYTDLVKAVLACDWVGRDVGFVKCYIQFLGHLASAQGSYVGLVLDMLVGYFHGGTLFVHSDNSVSYNVQ